jgi:hypothetical protein
MNISHEHKMIWFSPEMSGTENVSKTLEKHGFLGVEGKDEVELMDEYPDYKVICGIKNPYERVFLLHFEGDLRSIQLKKHHFDDLKVEFNDWGRRILIPNKLKIKVDETFINTNNTTKYLKKWVFNQKTPDFFVKSEDLINDLNKLGFKDDDIILNNDVKQFKFNQIYDFDFAKRVYLLYKKHFYLCDYNPFSFTDKELTDEEKISFLHDIV